MCPSGMTGLRFSEDTYTYMTLNEILEMWEKESQIDALNLDRASIDSAKLHAKYLSMLSIAKLKLKKIQLDFDALKKSKWEWFNGRMTKDQIDALGWKYDPFGGAAKPKLKENMALFYRTDADLSKISALIEYQTVIIDTLVDIMDNIKWRPTNIKNVIEWRKFVSGD